jgi:hypothetical protein
VDQAVDGSTPIRQPSKYALGGVPADECPPCEGIFYHYRLGQRRRKNEFASCIPWEAKEVVKEELNFEHGS